MKNFRSKVFKQAYEMMKATGKAFAVCLAKAWAIYRLYKRMKKETVSFSYEKQDGSLRKAKGTLQNVSNLFKGTGIENYKTVRYFDVDVDIAFLSVMVPCPSQKRFQSMKKSRYAEASPFSTRS